MDSQYFCVGHESFVLSPRENWYATMLGQPAVKISPVKSFEPPLLKDFAPPKWNTDISLRKPVWDDLKLLKSLLDK